MRYLFFTEASSAVGYGHLYESLAIAENIIDGMVEFILFESSDRAEALVRQQGYDVQSIQAAMLSVPEEINDACVVMDTRNNDISLQRAFRDKCKNLVIIDELGNKQLDCDAVVNFSLCEGWLSSYSCPETVRQFLGPAYYPLRKEFLSAREKNKKCPNIRVLISLGGADRTRTTLFLAELLSEIDNFEFTYVIGPGFDFGKDEVFERTKGKTNHKVVQCTENLARLMAQHSLIFSFGGNMLFEAAYLGVPAVIVWEDEHERVQGKAFEKKGTARVLGCASELKKPLIRKGFLELINNNGALRKMSISGQSLVDGKGCSRIADIIKRCG